MMRRLFLAGLTALLLHPGGPARAASSSDVLSVDLPALIDQVASQPERFAVDVAQPIALSAQGQWTTQGSRRVWTYTVRIPSAVSMSFHAAHLLLPPSAVLSVSGASASVNYRRADVSHGGLWSRPLLGDTLTLTLSVSASEAAAAQLQIASLQAGYRGLGGVPSHPAFMRHAAAVAATQSCQLNYSCQADSSNQGPAHATVAVLVGNQFQCTGTLLNNTGGDLAPYVLTARHCQNGKLGGGDPQAADAVTIYWDAVSPCGAALGSIYDGTAPTQSSATTVVEQQDAWLIRLDIQPVVADAYWAGWDASGSEFTGGYSVHHALGYNKQYVGWFGPALLQQITGKTLNVGYDSTFWGLVNQSGSVGAGSSGGGVFDPNDRLVGSASLAALQGGVGTAGVCPVSPPPTPTASTVTAQYTALSGVFASTSDTTSSTGSTTLRSVLDPKGSGMLALAGTGQLPMTLTVDQLYPSTFNTVTLTWNAAGALSCTADGGVAGDGWAGSKPTSGSATIANFTGGAVTYSMSCGGTSVTGHASVTVNWTYVAPYIDLTSLQPGAVMIGGLVNLQWDSNASPCVASGGVSGDGWAGSKSNPGQQNVTASQLGTITYKLTCGSGAQSASAQVSVQVIPLSVTITADSTQLRIGSYVTLQWGAPGYGDACTPSGGGSGDNWTTQTTLGSSGSDLVTETSPGTYTYTLTCSGGGQTATSSVSVVFTNAAPALSITALSPTQQVYPAGVPVGTPITNLKWSSNVTPCFLSALGPLTNSGVTLQGKYPGGTAADVEYVAGHYVYELDCGALRATTAIDWTTPNPSVTLTMLPAVVTTWVANTQYQLYWTTNTTPCTLTGGASGDGWGGSASGQGFKWVAEAAPGAYTFAVTCGTGTSQAQAQLMVTVPAAAVTLTSSASSAVVGQSVTLTYNSTVAPCTSQVPGDTPWAGSAMGTSGMASVFEAAVGTFTYGISCGSGSQAVQASTQVVVTAAVPTSISASANTAVVNTLVTLTWNSSSSTCTALGGWGGNLVGAGIETVTSAVTGTVVYGITCGGVDAQALVTYTAPPPPPPPDTPPSATLTSSLATQTAGDSVTLYWSSQNASACSASGGTGDDGWSGPLALLGSMSVKETTAGTDTYRITCTGAPPAASAQVEVKFTEPAGSGSSGSGGGGGGALDPLWLLLGSSSLVWQLARRRAH